MLDKKEQKEGKKKKRFRQVRREVGGFPVNNVNTRVGFGTVGLGKFLQKG